MPRRTADLLIGLWLVGVAGALIAAFHTRAYDDPYITYRYALNIAHGHGFVYNLGEPTLSTTTPLYALILASVAWLGGDVPLISNLISILALVGSGGVLWLFGRLWHTPSIGAAGALLYPTTVIPVMTIGSEMPLAIGLVLLGLLACAHHRYTLMAVALALAALVRFDSVLAVAVAGLAIVIEQGTLPALWRERSLAPLLRLPWQAAGIFLLMLAPWFVFALWYFGAPLPTTLATKQLQALLPGTRSFPAIVLAQFSQYSWNSWAWLAGGAALLGIPALLLCYRAWVMLVGWSVLYGLAYTLLHVAGYFWYVAPLIVGVVVLIGCTVQLGAEGLTRVRVPRGIAQAGAVALLPVIVWQVQYPALAWAQAHPDARYAPYRALGEWFAVHTAPDAKLGMLEIGIVGYYAEPRPVIDFAGLLQPATARQFSPTTSYAHAGVWAMHRYHPDYLVFHGQADLLFQADPLFATHCQTVHILESEAYPPLVIYRCEW